MFFQLDMHDVQVIAPVAGHNFMDATDEMPSTAALQKEVSSQASTSSRTNSETIPQPDVCIDMQQHFFLFQNM